MEDASDLTWLHPFRNAFPTYLADSDALVKPSVFCALIRTGYLVGCKVGTFPIGEAKVGLDELIDQAGDLEGAITQAQDVSQFILNSLPKIKEALEQEYSPSEADIERGRFCHQIIREISRHLLDCGTFALRYGSAFKKLGYSTPELRKIFTEAKKQHQLDNPDVPRLLAKNLAKGFFEDRLLFEAKTGLWYSYRETTGHWEQINERFANKLIDSAIEQAIKRQNFTRAYLSETKEFLESQLLVPQWEPTPGIINFQNGVLDLQGNEPILNPYDPSYRLTYCLPRIYVHIAGQETPTINAFLESLTGNSPSEIKKLNCFAAAVLRGITYLQIYQALVGDPGAGKGTWANFLISLVGMQACYSTTLESFCGNNFDSANCYGKRLVIFNDADQYSGNISKFLQFTGGDLVRGEIKGGASFNFKAEGFILITANKSVFVRSHPGLNRRTSLVQCVAPKKRKTDTLLPGKLLGEAEAYTSKVLAIEPAEIDQVLLDRGENNPRERLQLWQNQVETGSIASWADEYLVQDTTGKALIGRNASDPRTLFGSYCQFCQETKRQAKAFNSFSRDLIEALTSVLGWDVTKDREGSGHNTERPVVILGIRLRNPRDLTIVEQLQKIINEVDEKNSKK